MPRANRSVHRRIGSSANTRFLLQRALTLAELRAAITRARLCDLPVHRVLIYEGTIAEADYVAVLASSLGLPFVSDPGALGLISGGGRRSGRVGWAGGQIDGEPWVVLDGALGTPRAVASIARRLILRGRRVGLSPSAGLRRCVLASAGPVIMRQAIAGLARRDPSFSARAGSWLWQSLSLAVSVGILIGLAVIAGVSAQWLLALLLTLPILVGVALRLLVLLAYPLARPRRVQPLISARDRDLPVYTLLVPLFREARVVANLVEALGKLDYPVAKLDIKLILESIDSETLAEVRRLGLGPPFDVIVVPDRQPRGKPKALNYALAFARGDYVCVYDAEDIPDRDQLRRVVAHFANAPPTLGCVQGRLIIDNAAAGWLCRQFALEYATLFDGLLPALDHLRLPLPLGGTSNHFPLRVLRDVGAWDAWNVTEDADLGFRLARHGYRCELLATDTYEEAPHRLGAWLGQRTRWQKGWMQTVIVHNRQPLRLLTELGPWRWFGFQAQFGGIVVSSLVYPMSLAVLVVPWLTGDPVFHAETPTDRVLTWLTLFNLLAGLAVPMLHAAICTLGRGRILPLLDVPLMPLYWLLISLAAYRALFQLARDPFKWEKTEHGLSRRGRRGYRGEGGK